MRIQLSDVNQQKRMGDTVMNIDFSKYKRVFTFGCSFTKYVYPTWANVLSKCVPDAEFINLGQCGGGNSYISNRMTQANRTYTFCETDLVVTMWSTYCREDRFANDRWITPGNIYCQGEYDEAFVKKFCDPVGYMIKDLSTIDLATAYMSTLPCTYIDMLSVPFNHQVIEQDDPTYKDVLYTYRELIAHFNEPSMFDYLDRDWCTGGGGLTYIHRSNNKSYYDYHPNTLVYCNYLKAIGIPLTDAAIEYAEESYAKAVLVKHENEFASLFPEINYDSGFVWKI